MADEAATDARHRRGRASDESGFTLIELLVAMGIFSIFIAILLGATLQLARGTVRVQVTAQTTSDVLIVFQNLDRQVRFADAINSPGTGASGDRYIEFRVPAAGGGSGVATCRQWRFRPDDGLIESRSWEDQAGSAATGWATKLTNAIDVGGAGYPFKLDSSASTMQKLVLTVNAGSPDSRAGAAISTSFAARNSSSSQTAQVCVRAGSRQ